jgi:hypothetical protein
MGNMELPSCNQGCFFSRGECEVQSENNEEGSGESYIYVFRLRRYQNFEITLEHL